MAFWPRDSDWNTYVSRSFWNIQFQCRCFPPQHLFHRLLRQTLFPASCVFPRMHICLAAILFEYVLHCSLTYILADRSDISSAILLNGIHCTTLGMSPVHGGCHHTWYDSWELRSCLRNRIHRPSRNTVPHGSLRPPWYQQSVSYGSSGMVYQSRADHSIYNRLVRALQLRLVLQQSVCVPCGQAVHRSAFRLACEETLSCAAHGKRYFLGMEGYYCCCCFSRASWCTWRIVSSFLEFLDALFSNGKFCL